MPICPGMLAVCCRRRSYQAHVKQLAAAKPKRQLVVGTWSREEVSRNAGHVY
jgi:hypothetical protein